MDFNESNTTLHTCSCKRIFQHNSFSYNFSFEKLTHAAGGSLIHLIHGVIRTAYIDLGSLKHWGVGRHGPASLTKWQTLCVCVREKQFVTV